jgi:hypothetical protein
MFIHHAVVALLTTIVSASGNAPSVRCASEVIAYDPGSGAGPSYRDPLAALGEPTRFTGTGIEPGAVTPFRPAFMPGEIVSIGRGGQLVLAFEEHVADDPRHPYGIDLIVYGNAFCGDVAYPEGVAGPIFGEGGVIELSIDGVDWRAVPEAEADGGLPTLAYVDTGPYSTAAGAMPTSWDRPVPPAITAASMEGVSYEELVTMYDGGGGGTRIDLAAVGLASCRFVRIRVPADATAVPEVDAVVAVRPTLRGDLDGNGQVDGADLGLMLGAWGTCPDCAADLDADGQVDGTDLGILLGSWS